MILELIIFIVACVTTYITLKRKPKIRIPKEIEVLEEEIESWLKSKKRI